MRRCVFCRTGLGSGEPPVPDPRLRHAYDPALGRMWEICPGCQRWNPIPLALRWEALEGWEARVRREGRVLIRGDELTLLQVEGGEVVRVGRPPLGEWGGWRYGTRIPVRPRRRSFLGAVLGALPPLPLEGYDPYGLGGSLGGVGGRGGPREWLASPFLDRAQPLTVGFTSVPFARVCPSCSIPMPLNPWDFQRVTFRIVSGAPGVEAHCANCSRRIALPLAEARPGLRFGLAILDLEPEARDLGKAAGAALEGSGGREVLLEGLGRLGAPLGELGTLERVALAIALDQDAEVAALESEWREAEEIAGIMDGELTVVPGFQEFRARVLGNDGGA